MTTMREAFDEFMAHADWKFADREAAWKWMYEAGYAAAIAAVREGGPVVTVEDAGGIAHLPRLQWVSANISLETPFGTELYHLPEDEK